MVKKVIDEAKCEERRRRRRVEKPGRDKMKPLNSGERVPSSI